VYHKSGGTTGQSWHDHSADAEKGNAKKQGGNEFKNYKVERIGYTDCGCKDAEWTPGVVLDPFSVAERLARSLPRTEGTGSESNSSRSISKWQCAA